jgi:uncharacterized protein
MADEFTLDLRNLDAAGKIFAAPLPVPWLAEALRDCDLQPTDEPGEVKVRFSRSGADIVVKGFAKALLQIPCARCLEPVLFPATGEITLLLIPRSSARGDHAAGKAGPGHSKGGSSKRDDETEMSLDDADLDTYDGDHIPLSGFIRESLLLETPTFPLCKEDCAGIAPALSESAEINSEPVDPRLAPLLELAKKTPPQRIKLGVKPWLSPSEEPRVQNQKCAEPITTKWLLPTSPPVPIVASQVFPTAFARLVGFTKASK